MSLQPTLACDSKGRSKQIVLSYAGSHGSVKIILTVMLRVDNYDGIPVAYAFNPNYGKAFDHLLLAVGPGVSLKFDKVRPPTGSPNYGLVPLNIEICRVQDPRVIPPIGEFIDQAALLSVHQTHNFSSSFEATPFIIEAHNRGMRFRLRRKPSTGIDIEVPVWQEEGQPRDAFARFAYEVETSQVTIVASPRVTVKPIYLGSNTPIAPGSNKIIPPSTKDGELLSTLFRVHRVRSVQVVPPQGTALKKFSNHPRILWLGDDERYVWHRKYAEADKVNFARNAIDIVIGMTPGLGDFVEVAEFSSALFTDRDRWGRKISTTDKVLMGIGALLPFVAGPALRGARRVSTKRQAAKIIKQAGLPESQLDRVHELLTRLKDARLTQEERGLFTRVIKAVQENGVLQNGDIESLLETYRKIRGEPPTIHDLLNGGGTGFLDSDLNARYVKSLLDPKRDNRSAFDWAINTRGLSRNILESRLGKNYSKKARKASSRTQKVIYKVPRPMSLSKSKLRSAMTTLAPAQRELARYLKSVPGGGVTSESFDKVRGEIGELLAKNTMLKELASVEHSMKASTKAVKRGKAYLVSAKVGDDKTKIQTWWRGEKRWFKSQFSDSLIVFLPDDRSSLAILRVFEVKSGSTVSRKIHAQIEDWREWRLQSGSELLIPEGAILTPLRGAPIELDSPLKFMIRPKEAAEAGKVRGQLGVIRSEAPKNPRPVTGLFSAKRVAIVPNGVSMSGSRWQTDLQELVQSPDHIDYLAGRIAKHPLTDKIPAPLNMQELDYITQYAISRLPIRLAAKVSREHAQD